LQPTHHLLTGFYRPWTSCPIIGLVGEDIIGEVGTVPGPPIIAGVVNAIVASPVIGEVGTVPGLPIIGVVGNAVLPCIPEPSPICGLVGKDIMGEVGTVPGPPIIAGVVNAIVASPVIGEVGTVPGLPIIGEGGMPEPSPIIGSGLVVFGRRPLTGGDTQIA